MRRTIVAAVSTLTILAACQTTEQTATTKPTSATAQEAPPTDKPVQQTATVPTGALSDWLIAHSPCQGEWRFTGGYGDNRGPISLSFRKEGDKLVADWKSRSGDGKNHAGPSPVTILGPNSFGIWNNRHEFTREPEGSLTGTHKPESGFIYHSALQCSKVG